MRLLLTLLLLSACAKVPTPPAPPDADQDGFVDSLAGGDDCDDADPARNPDQVEACNGVDDDCDGFVDDHVLSPFFADADGDGFGAGDALMACEAPDGYVADDTDCDDTNEVVHPTAEEACDGLDDDCDGDVDEGVLLTLYADRDGDGYGDADETELACAPGDGWVADDTDCDDRQGDVHPGAAETCDERDEDCDGSVDEGLSGHVWYPDADGDGYGDAGGAPVDACGEPVGYTPDDSDCDDAAVDVHPLAIESCNGLDDDCDGTIDDVTDAADGRSTGC